MKQNRIYWNRDWQFSKSYSDELLKKEPQNVLLESVTLPHTTAETPFHYFDESEIYEKEYVDPKKVNIDFRIFDI